MVKSCLIVFDRISRQWKYALLCSLPGDWNQNISACCTQPAGGSTFNLVTANLVYIYAWHRPHNLLCTYSGLWQNIKATDVRPCGRTGRDFCQLSASPKPASKPCLQFDSITLAIGVALQQLRMVIPSSFVCLTPPQFYLPMFSPSSDR